MPAAKPIAPRRRRMPTERADAIVNKPCDKEGKPLHHYVLVPKSSGTGTYTVGHYQQMGYKVVPLITDGPRISGIPKDSPPAPHQEWMGCLLMSLDMDEYEDIQQYGLDGEGGYALMAQHDRDMSAPVRKNRDHQWVDEVNETEPAQFVREV